jgi:hypothetical protein
MSEASDMSAVTERREFPIPDEVLGRLPIITLAEVRDVFEATLDDRFRLGPVQPICREIRQWFLYGHGATDKNGEAKLHLSQLVCERSGPTGNQRIGDGIPRFLATPKSSQARHLSYEFDIEPAKDAILPPGSFWDPTSPFDVTVHVYSWGADGSRAGHVAFSWHCAVNYTLLTPQ